jgi:hypothetical protein
MGKFSKTALAFLYLAQIIVIYKAGVDGVYENATGAEDHHSHGKTAVHQALSGLKVVLKRAVRAKTDPPQVMFAAPVAVGIVLATEHEHEEHHEHLPHEKFDLPRRARRRLHNGFLIAKLIQPWCWSFQRVPTRAAAFSLAVIRQRATVTYPTP